MWSKLKAFLRGWWYTRTQRDPEIVAKALGRPDTLELSNIQCMAIQECFVTMKQDPADMARSFYSGWPRTDFRYFMAPSPDGQALEFTKPDYAYEGIELIYAAMRKVGAIVVKEDGEYFENAHPMVQRFAEIASKVEIPQPKGRGILG